MVGTVCAHVATLLGPLPRLDDHFRLDYLHRRISCVLILRSRSTYSAQQSWVRCRAVALDVAYECFRRASRSRQSLVQKDTQSNGDNWSHRAWSILDCNNDHAGGGGREKFQQIRLGHLDQQCEWVDAAGNSVRHWHIASGFPDHVV